MPQDDTDHAAPDRDEDAASEEPLGSPAPDGLDDDALAGWSERARIRREERLSSSRVSRTAERPRWLKAAAIGSAAVVVLLVLLEVATSAGRIHPGVVVGDVRVGGLGKTAAAERIAEQVAPRIGAPVVVTYGDKKWTVDSASIEASLDPAPFVESAYAVGRSGGFGEQIAQRASAWFGKARVSLAASADPTATTGVLDVISADVRIEPKDATVTIDGTEAAIVPSADGLDIVREAVEADLLEAFVSTERAFEAVTAAVPVEVVDADAQQALQDALMMLSAPAEIRFEDKTWTFAPADIAKWIVFEKRDPVETSTTPEAVEDDAGSEAATFSIEVPRKVLVARIGADEISDTVLPKMGAIVVLPTDAAFSVSNGVVTIIPHKDGTGPDLPKLAEDLTGSLTVDGPRSVELSTARVEPAITTEKAQGMGIKERISTYTTTYSASNKPRVNNIHTLADALDGALIPPGGVFSFNGHVGQRTAEKGYQEANAIVRKDGQLVLEPQLGGGICQVGTTFFNSVFFSGLPVVERRNHSFYIDHYPKGRDATVSWGGPDFKFKNDTDNWVVIKTAHSSGSVTISLYGTDPGYEVEYTTGAWTNIRPHGVIEKEDPAIDMGVTFVEDGGVDGATIVVKRIVTKGGAVLRTDTFTSNYKPKTEVVKIGTKPPSKTATSSPSATKTP